MKNEFYPSLEMAQNALTFHSRRIARSITHLLKTIENDLRLSDPRTQLALEVTEKSNRFHPETHFFHNRLIIAMRSQNRESAENECRELINSLVTRVDDNIIDITSVGAAQWERCALDRAVSSATAETGLQACVTPVPIDVFVQQRAHLKAALELLSQFDPAGHAELITLIRHVKLFSGKVVQGLSDTQVFGAIYIRAPRACVDPIPYYAEHAIHETAHTYLNCLMAEDPMVANNVDDKFPSPLRKDLRPMYAVYHATFVAARMALTFKNIFERTGDLRWAKMLAEVTDETIRGLKTISAAGNLTHRGTAIINNIQGLIPQIAEMSIWNEFRFDNPMPHRCGAGTAHYTDFKKYLSLQ